MAMAPQSAVATGYYASGNEGGDPSRLAPDRSGGGAPFFGGQPPGGPMDLPPGAGQGTVGGDPSLNRSQGEAGNREPVAGPQRGSKGEVLARVGNDVILASDLGVDRIRADNIDRLRMKYRGEVPPYVLDDLERTIRELIRERLKKKVEIKLLYQHAVKHIQAERLPQLKDLVAKDFENNHIPELMKEAKAGSRLELEQKLREAGTSLELSRSEYVEGYIATIWQRSEVKVDEEISRDELLRYYREHSPEFDRPARALWEQLTVRIAKYRSPQAAKAALARMGNDVLFRGVPLADVAKARSDGPTASGGGAWPWTREGELVSKKIDRAIFGLPIGELSQILEEESEMHIVRVLQRQPATRVPFEEAQAGIRKTLRKNREKEAKDAFLARVRREIIVWTIYDEEEAKQTSMPLFLR